MALETTPETSEPGSAPAAPAIGVADVAATASLDARTLLRFGLVAAQLALVLLLINLFEVEQSRGLPRLTPVIFFGFLVHAALPQRFRLAFFVLLSFAGFGLVFGPWLAPVLIGAGLLLIAICHAPVSWWLRIGLLLSAGAVLTALRGGALRAPGTAAILPVLGSIFMFRLIVYVYDLRTEATPVSIWHRLGYFFLLPNALFPLFPIIDYRTWLRTYYDGDAHAIYLKGVRWILRGVVHLLIYRLIYLEFTPPEDAVRSLNMLVLFMVSAYLLYLRVSGLFHLIVGILALFGFNLPETHHLYLLASGFNDLWRRINIYWKNFMMKIFYYPVFVRLRRKGPTMALVVATLVVFFVSWLLHSYQWFWIRGTFPLTVVDAIFWTAFAVLVLANSLLQAKYGTRRSLGGARVTFVAALTHSLKVVGMFCFMCMLWSFWLGESIDDYVALLEGARGSDPMQAVYLVAALLTAVAVGTASQLLLPGALERLKAQRSFAYSSATASVTMLVLLFIASPETTGWRGPRLIQRIRAERLNAQDEQAVLRGYYEEILAGKKKIGPLWETRAEKPEDFESFSQSGLVDHEAEQILGHELHPDMQGTFRGAGISTNRWRMRDRDYTIEKPEGTCRIALLGASIEMGWGVEDDEVFEAITEQMLNDANTGGSYEKYEILNFAVSGYSLLHQLVVFEKSALTFDPDIVMFVAHPNDYRLLQAHIRRIVDKNIEVYPRLRKIIERSGLYQVTSQTQAERAFRDYRDLMMTWTLQRLAGGCTSRSIEPVWVLLDHLPGTDTSRIASGRKLRELATHAGFMPIVLDTHFLEDDEMLLDGYDRHPDAEGHQLLAEELFRQLHERERELGLGLTYRIDGGSR